MSGADPWQAQELLEQQQWEYEKGCGHLDGCPVLIRPVKANAQGFIMPKISDMLPSTYLKQSDVDEDYIVTVVKLEQKNVAPADSDPEMKWTVRFAEFDKPMVLNSTNIQLMAKACDSDDTDDWIGKEVIVYTDPNVSYGGQLVGGLRIKKHKVSKPVAPKARAPLPAAAREAPMRSGSSDSEGFANEDVPFITSAHDLQPAGTRKMRRYQGVR